MASYSLISAHWLVSLYLSARFITCNFIGTPSLFGNDLIARRLFKYFKIEASIAILFIASLFMFSIEIERDIFAIFFLSNFLVQVSIKEIQSILARQNAKKRTASGSLFDHKSIILGTGVQAKETADFVLDHPELESDIIGFLDFRKEGLWSYRDIPLLGNPSILESFIANNHIDLIIFAIEPSDMQNSREVFEVAEKMGLPICMMPSQYQARITRPRNVSLNGFSVEVYTATPENRVALFMKSVIDKIGALCGIILALPIMICAALAIKLESKGPVFFTQNRSGLNGKQFGFIKFRSMTRDAEKKKDDLLDKNEMSGPVFKITNDPRVTTVGKFIRKYSIDELPQLFNVLIGDMSLVGPRPPIPAEVSKYEPWQRRKLSIKPGITCKWQVSGRNQIDFEDWMRLDLDYIDNWSLWEDSKILVKTIPAVLKGDGAS